MSISIYLILLIVLLVFNLVFWLLVIWFRILFNCDLGICCCSDAESNADNESPSAGHRNQGFIDDDPATTRQAPFSVMEAVESPPSYEEALKYDQFGFQTIPVVYTASSSSRSQVPNHPQGSHSPSGGRITQMSQSPPRVSDVRSRSSTSGSTSLLTPIREEDDDTTPVTVVIDCIGVQASRLLPNCDTKVEISDGEQLNSHSKC